MRELNNQKEMQNSLNLIIKSSESYLEFLLFNCEWPEIAAAYERTRDYLDDLKRIQGNID